MSNKKRVVVTGIGIVSPVGNDLQTSWNNIKNGVSGIDNITLFDTAEFATKFAGEVKGCWRLPARALVRRPNTQMRAECLEHDSDNRTCRKRRVPVATLMLIGTLLR